jgi:hypothetical protein
MKVFKRSIIVLSGAEGLCLGQEDSKQTHRITTGMMRCLQEISSLSSLIILVGRFLQTLNHPLSCISCCFPSCLFCCLVLLIAPRRGPTAPRSPHLSCAVQLNIPVPTMFFHEKVRAQQRRSQLSILQPYASPSACIHRLATLSSLALVDLPSESRQEFA